MTNGLEFGFDSIEEVANACIPRILEVLESATPSQTDIGSTPTMIRRKRLNSISHLKIILAGWSYGGVVASEVAKQIELGYSNRIAVQSVTMFDSPLRKPLNINESSSYDESTIADKIKTLSTSADLSDRIKKHFQVCTDLLAKYHKRPQEDKILKCPILDIRPLEADFNFSISDVEELTTGKVERKFVPGSHWTMLFEEFAQHTIHLFVEFNKNL